MADSNEKIIQLQARLDKMVEYQDYFYREINQIKNELKILKTENQTDGFSSSESKPPTSENFIQPTEHTTKAFPRQPFERQRQTVNADFPTPQVSPAPDKNSNIEEFVGRNLISLIGIIITILGVGIGAKYAIDRDLISPATRIVLGYLFAAGMFGIAVWLKRKYLNFSAVLLSGSLAMLYFLTFFAYSFYGRIPQNIAFSMMLFFTAFTVAAAINYNRQVIAHIALVGAYAVPFLLSENSGRVDILFSYMTIINFGILAVSVKKFWKPLFYSSFIFTWLIYAACYFPFFPVANDFSMAFGFAFVFFLTFYLTFLSYKLIAKEEFSAEIIILVFVNSFIFYGFGYSIIKSRESFERFLGLFTLLNALLNFFFAVVIHKYKLGDKKNLYLAIALAITFATLAVPVQFSGNWVTLLWTAEAAILFWIGRIKKISLYENLSYPLMILASLSLLNDWQNALNSRANLTPILNRDFLTSILFAVAFGFIIFINRDKTLQIADENFRKLFNFAAPTVFLFVLYNSFRVEIANYYHLQTLFQPVILSDFDQAELYKISYTNYFNAVWQINYSMFFLTVLSFVNIAGIKNSWLGLINLALNSVILLVFLTVGLYSLGELRHIYLWQSDSQILQPGFFNVVIRYISLAFAAALIYASFKYTEKEFFSNPVSKFSLIILFDFVFHASLLWIISSELINLTDIFRLDDSYKLGLSILWGLYALTLIILGIVKKKKHLRIGAIVLFALTLIKLFFYDIAELDTISKTIVFVSLGILLLIISFLYNKYKDLIFEKTEL